MLDLQRVIIVRDQSDGVASSPPVVRAETELAGALEARGAQVERRAGLSAPSESGFPVVLSGFDTPVARDAFEQARLRPPSAAESLALLPRYAFDPARAKQLLAEAGYPGGIQIQLSCINRAVDQQQAQILKQMLGDVGITANLDVLERIAWTDKMATGQYEMGTFFTTMRRTPTASWRDASNQARGRITRKCRTR